MVKKSGNVYQCESCEFKYLEKEWADKCEAFCTTHNGCSLEITKHAVKRG